MKKIFLLFVLALSPQNAFSSNEGRTGNWTEVVEAPEGRYSLDFNAVDSLVDVTKLDDETAMPSAIKIRIHRKNDRPLDLRLKALDIPNEPLRYSGRFQDWNGSVMGFELQMSFDKKLGKK
jgi:hypothetical protein